MTQARPPQPSPAQPRSSQLQATQKAKTSGLFTSPCSIEWHCRIELLLLSSSSWSCLSAACSRELLKSESWI